jgi:aspartate kinase
LTIFNILYIILKKIFYRKGKSKMNIKVVKFGGSSLADAEHFKQVASIIKADPARRYVVASAPGKRSKEDIKVTDLFYECYERARTNQNIDEVYAKIVERYTDIMVGLGLECDMSKEFDYVKSALQHRSGRDFAASRGEYLNSIILAKYLKYDFIDAESVIFFKDNGVLDAEKTNEIMRQELLQHKNAVVPGFYGVMPNGTIKTFSRGGSDVTGSIVARAIDADIYENWTDVSGCLMADPRIVDDPCPIKRVSYRELRELSYMGASVLHEDAIFPVKMANIPINIRNTNRPQDAGTMIVAENNEFDAEKVITGIAGRKGFSVITIEKDMMNSEIGYGRRVLEVLENNEISFEHLPSGIDNMSVVIESKALDGRRDKVFSALNRAVKADRVTIEDGLALIAIVGHGMVKYTGTAARVFNAISAAGINIKMIDQGSSEFSIIVGVEEQDFDNALRAIYSEFVK